MKPPSHDSWKVLETRDLFSAPPWISVQSQSVRLPDGKRVDDFYRVTFPDYALVFAERQDGRVLVLRQYKHGVGAVSLTFPAGTFNDPSEDPLACARRELMEETGYEAAAWRSLGRYVSHANAFGNAAHFFHAMGCRKVAEPNSGDLEEMELLLMTRAELFAAAREGAFKLVSQLAILGLVTHPEMGRAAGPTG
ncbi:MAG: NUDIX hydrolase [Alphaproteobacteria bacterium]|nr:NUDIX hydrolase [Alphaproteobacteria bacterium]